MADDAAAPEGELSESTEGDDAPRDEALRGRASATEENLTATSTPDGSSESPTEADATEDIEDTATAADGDTDLTEAELAALGVEPKPGMSHVKVATIIGLVVVLALAGLVGWLGFRAYDSQKAEHQRELILQVGRQGALNLTTIDFEHADADVQRILDSATDTFYDDFSKRSQPFVVAVTVKTANAGAAEQAPRAWRMRIMVKKTGADEAKVSNVEFVP